MLTERLDRVLVGFPLVALAVFGVTLGDARVLTPPSAPPALTVDSMALPGLPRPAPVPPSSAIERAVDRAPFRPDRTRPPERYRLPPTPGTTPTFAAPATRLPGLALLGTVIFQDGRGLAALTVPGQQPRLVRVGESFEGYKVKAVTRAGVTLTGPDSTITLRPPGSPQP